MEGSSYRHTETIQLLWAVDHLTSFDPNYLTSFYTIETLTLNGLLLKSLSKHHFCKVIKSNCGYKEVGYQRGFDQK